MRAGNMAAGVNHHHERRPDGKRRNNTRARANSRATNCQNKEESSDEFCYVFVHIVRFVFFVVDEQLSPDAGVIQRRGNWKFNPINSWFLEISYRRMLPQSAVRSAHRAVARLFDDPRTHGL